jgi:hypothetical protein
VRFGVDRRPRAAFGFIFSDATILVPFLDMLGLPFLFVGVRALVASRHGRSSSSANLNVRKTGKGSVRTARADFVFGGRESAAPLTMPNTMVILRRLLP